jgi:hypothetical protein
MSHIQGDIDSTPIREFARHYPPTPDNSTTLMRGPLSKFLPRLTLVTLIASMLTTPSASFIHLFLISSPPSLYPPAHSAAGILSGENCVYGPRTWPWPGPSPLDLGVGLLPLPPLAPSPPHGPVLAGPRGEERCAPLARISSCLVVVVVVVVIVVVLATASLPVEEYWLRACCVCS